MSTVAKEHPWTSVEPYRVSVEQYRTFRRDGFLIVRDLVSREHVDELLRHTEDLMYGRVEIDGVEPPVPNSTLREMEKRILRIHMLHREVEIWERYLLHPRVLDVVQALNGADVLAMQTMMFIKGPGADGQGFHQDTYYIPTFPDSLIGAWIALERADTENGCMPDGQTGNSQVEPICIRQHHPATATEIGVWRTCPPSVVSAGTAILMRTRTTSSNRLPQSIPIGNRLQSWSQATWPSSEDISSIGRLPTIRKAVRDEVS